MTTYLRYGKRDCAIAHLRTVLANAPRHERARTLLPGLGLRCESM